MKTTELRMSFFKEASAIIDNDELLEEAIKMLRKLRGQKAAETDEAHPYTAEEIAARIEASLADEAAGEVYTSDEVKQQMERKYPFLCK